VVALGRYAHSADRDLRHMIEPLVAFNEVVVVVYTVERNARGHEKVPAGGQQEVPTPRLT